MTAEPIQVARDSFPRSWRIARVQDVATVNALSLPEGTDPDYSFDYIDISTVSSLGEVGIPEPLRFSEAPSRARRVVRAGDILVSTVRTYLRAIARIPQADNVVASTGFAVVSPGLGIDKEFLYWWLRSDPLVEQIVAQSVGVSYPAINATEVAHLTVPLPSRETQHHIATYLDRECSRIDALVQEQGRLAALAQERIQAAILRLLCGVQAGTESMPGGFPVSADRPLRTLKQAGVSVTTGPFGTQLSAGEYSKSGVPVVNPTHIVDGRIRPGEECVPEPVAERLGRHRLRGGDIVTGRKGDLGRSALVGEPESGFLCGSDSIALHIAGSQLDPGYVAAALRLTVVRQQLLARSTGSTMPNLNEGNLLGLQIPVPDKGEQIQIAAAMNVLVEEQRALHDELLAQKRLLLERKQAVITAAVTGKLQVA